MGKYHVVCHECPEEQVLDDPEAAQRLRESHEESTAHRVSCKRITPPASDA